MKGVVAVVIGLASACSLDYDKLRVASDSSAGDLGGDMVSAGSGGATTGTGGTIAGGTGGVVAGGTGGFVAGGTGGFVAGGAGGTMSGGAGGSGSGGASVGDAPVDMSTDTAGQEIAPDTGSGILTFTSDIAPILARVCGGCHGNAAGMMVSMLTSVTGTVSAAHTNCGKVDASKKRIVAGSPDRSYLYAKITMTTAQLGPGCGNAMPASGMLTVGEKAMIGTWIMQGAN